MANIKNDPDVANFMLTAVRGQTTYSRWDCENKRHIVKIKGLSYEELVLYKEDNGKFHLENYDRHKNLISSAIRWADDKGIEYQENYTGSGRLTFKKRHDHKNNIEERMHWDQWGVLWQYEFNTPDRRIERTLENGRWGTRVYAVVQERKDANSNLWKAIDSPSSSKELLHNIHKHQKQIEGIVKDYRSKFPKRSIGD